MENIEISEYENILLNMSGGLLPENLSRDEVEIIEKKLGINWFDKLGYSKYPEHYKKPDFGWTCSNCWNNGESVLHKYCYICGHETQQISGFSKLFSE